MGLSVTRRADSRGKERRNDRDEEDERCEKCMVSK